LRPGSESAGEFDSAYCRSRFGPKGLRPTYCYGDYNVAHLVKAQYVRLAKDPLLHNDRKTIDDAIKDIATYQLDKKTREKVFFV
jgi:hypothetical protein